MLLARLTRGFAIVLAISGTLLLPIVPPILWQGWLIWSAWIAIGLGVRWINNPFFWFYSLLWNVFWLVPIARGTAWANMNFQSQHLVAHLIASVTLSATALALQVSSYIQSRRKDGCQQ